MEVQITRRMWAVTIVTGLGMGLALEGVLRVFGGSTLLPVAFLATAVVIIMVFRKWLYTQFRKQHPEVQDNPSID